MTPQPSQPTGRQRLTRGLLLGGILAVVGVLLFILLWNTLNSLENAPRLFIAMCIPPAVIALVMGVYLLVARPPRS
ncbi:MAG: hypothetical protein SF162_01980 [bacterium]|nr:hypothetical protein [bacterium]